MRQRWFRFGFASPLGFWFRSAWRFPRPNEYLRMMDDYQRELEEELSEVKEEIEKLKTASREQTD